MTAPRSTVVVVTGASSGFGALTVRHFASAGHTVYAGMRDIAGRNAPHAAALPSEQRSTGWTCEHST